MADEILKRDQNSVTVLAGVTDDADLDITMLRVDPITKRLLVKATLPAGSGGQWTDITGGIYYEDKVLVGGTTPTTAAMFEIIDPVTVRATSILDGTYAYNDGVASIDYAGNITTEGDVSGANLSGTNTGDQTTITGNAGTATALQTPRAIYGNNFDGSAALTQVIASTYGGTGNGFTKFTGATTSEKTYTLPNANATILTTDAPVSILQGGTGQTTANAGFNALSPMTTKGDLIVRNGSNVAARVPVGTNYQILIADSAQANGLKWGTPILPAGVIVEWPSRMSTIPAYSLLCNGQAVSRTTYSVLFAVIGTAYGAGNGTTTFNVPNLQNLFTIGACCETASGTGFVPTSSISGSLAATGGCVALSLSLCLTDSGHSHSLNYSTTTVDSNNDGSTTSAVSSVDSSTSSSTTGITGSVTGNAIPPYRAMYKIISTGGQ